MEDFRDGIRPMDEPALLAFGRKHRAHPDSIEYQEAQAEWLRGQEKNREIPTPQPPGPTSGEFAAMAKAAGDRYTWRRYPA
jgi:hypothetical protein